MSSGLSVASHQGLERQPCSLLNGKTQASAQATFLKKSFFHNLKKKKLMRRNEKDSHFESEVFFNITKCYY